MSGITGRCLCGKVSYAAASPLVTAICHCTRCRRQSGSAFAVNLVVLRKSLETEGETKVFSEPGGSGQAVERHFCPSCGSPLFTIAESAPGVAFIKGGTLDEWGTVEPSMEIWVDQRLPWAALETALPAHATNPPA